MVELKWKLESSQFSNNKKLPAQGKVDLEFQHPFRGFLLWGRIENLLRSNYVSPFGFPAPGVNFLIGFKTKF
jgi:outer membrane cobalamin receptor